MRNEAITVSVGSISSNKILQRVNDNGLIWHHMSQKEKFRPIMDFSVAVVVSYNSWNQCKVFVVHSVKHEMSDVTANSIVNSVSEVTIKNKMNCFCRKM